MTCPCGGEEQDTCCGPVLAGERFPATAAELMKARYTAYATQEIDFIVESHHPERRDEVDRDGAEKWSAGAEWQGLEIVSTKEGGANDQKGVVEFIARYKVDEVEYRHHENAVFDKIDGRWFFTDGEMVRPKPVVRDKPCLLYTSPSPRDRTRSRMPSSA